jgi:transposase-like protein
LEIVLAGLKAPSLSSTSGIRPERSRPRVRPTAQRSVVEDVANRRRPGHGRVPRARDASFEPRIVPKHARSFDGFEEQILALYAAG